MILKKWLTTTSRGAARLTSEKPYLKADEITVLLQIELPNSLFSKPHLEATIKVPESAVVREVISAQVVDNIENIVHEATGLEIVVKVVEPESEDENI